MNKSTKDSMSETFGEIAAIDTITTNFPTLINVDSLIGATVQSSLDMILKLLSLCGVDARETINLLSRILSGQIILDAENTIIEDAVNKTENYSGGLLDTLEMTIKIILIANLKDLFGGCPIEPILPDNMMLKCSNSGVDVPNPIGIEIPLEGIDFFGVLKNAPTDNFGSIFYSDTENINTPNDTWKSTDFNAYLWFIINKGNISTTKHKNIWDNRVSYLKPYKNGDFSDSDYDYFYSVNDINGTHAFLLKDDNGNYSEQIENSIYVKDAPDKCYATKKQYVICEYQEQTNNNTNNVIRLWANADRYYKTLGTIVNGKKVGINKTIFEFNYDYVMSLKLFDSKTIVANVLNALFSLTNTIKPVLDINGTLTIKKVEAMVDNVLMMVSDENYEDDSNLFTFSNEEFDKMLNQTINGNKIIQNSNIDTEEIINGIKNIGKNNNNYDSVNNLIINAITQASEPKYQFDSDIKFKFDFSFIREFLHQTVTQIVMQLLTPKLMMLYAVNMAVMGDITDITGWQSNMKNAFSGIDNILKTFQNLIVSLIKEIIKALINELMAYLMKKIKEWIELFSVQLLMETVKDYKDLVNNLINTCSPIIPIGSGTLDIEDVYNADIVTPQTKPSEINNLKNNTN